MGKLDDLKDHLTLQDASPEPGHPSEVVRNRQIGTTNTAGIPFWTAGYQLDILAGYWLFAMPFKKSCWTATRLDCQRAVSSSPSSPWHQVKVKGRKWQVQYDFITSSDSETGQSDSFWSCDAEFLLQFSEVIQFSTVFYSFLQFSTRTGT